MNKLKKLLKSPLTWKVLGVATLLLASNVGFCAGDISSIDTQIADEVKKVTNVIFGKGIRLVVLLFGMAWGFFKTVMSGTFQPILLYGGLGLSFFFIPKLIELVGSVGS